MITKKFVNFYVNVFLVKTCFKKQTASLRTYRKVSSLAEKKLLSVLLQYD